ncbi:unnamed protein product [Prorocentrum cordatum]|uniref:Inorganic diphosphatase n=1 Tax=Prorocentrum cordatum TaxID=2364126 RepID=A0ABN9SR64_9DINO|nr:unnamed protein product [Polarella glacialis]
MGKEGRTNDVMVAAWTKAKATPVLDVLAMPDVDGDVDKQWNFSARRSIEGFIDVIANCGELSGVNWETVKEAMADGRCNSLPPPLGFSDDGQNDVPCVMNMRVSKSLPGAGCLVVKVFAFLGGGERMSTILEKIVEGDPCVLDSRPDTFNSARALPVVLEAMGRWLFRYWCMQKPGVAAEKQAALNRAWNFAQAEAPRGHFDGQRALWLERQCAGPDSPIYHAKREFEDYYPPLKPDVRKEYQPMTNRTPKTLTGNALLAIGGAGSGETPFMCVLAVATARRNVDVANERRPGRAKAAVRVSAEMDFFRREVGGPRAPCIFDDGDLADQRPRVLKAFLDPAQAEAVTCARWGAAKFARGEAGRQAKFGGDDEYNASADPNGEEWGLAATSSDAAKRTAAILADMIRPAFPKGLSESNLGAMLQRCNVALNTRHSFFFRPAGKDSVVEKLPPMSSYIAAEAGKISMRPLQRKKPRDQEGRDGPLAFEKKDALKLMAEARDAAGARGDGGDGAAAAAAAGGAPAGAAAPWRAGQSGGLGAAPEDDDLFGRRGGADVADEEDVFGFGGGKAATEPTPPKGLTAARNARVEQLVKFETNAGMIVPWQTGAASGSSGGASAPSGEAAPADAAPEVQPLIVGCHGALPEEDHREQMAIFHGFAQAHHGAHEDLVTPPRGARKTGLARGWPLSPVDRQEQQAIFASIVSQAHGETIAIDDGDVDLDAEMGAVLEADQLGGDAEQLGGGAAEQPDSDAD